MFRDRSARVALRSVYTYSLIQTKEKKEVIAHMFGTISCGHVRDSPTRHARFHDGYGGWYLPPCFSTVRDEPGDRLKIIWSRFLLVGDWWCFTRRVGRRTPNPVSEELLFVHRSKVPGNFFSPTPGSFCSGL